MSTLSRRPQITELLRHHHRHDNRRRKPTAMCPPNLRRISERRFLFYQPQTAPRTRRFIGSAARLMRWHTLETVQPSLNLFLTAAEVREDGTPIRFLRFDSINRRSGA